MELLPSQNKEWGFYGQVITNYHVTHRIAALYFFEASQAIHEMFPLEPAESIRNVLDSRLGRHLANDLSFHNVATGKFDIADCVKSRGWPKEIKYHLEIEREALDAQRRLSNG